MHTADSIDILLVEDNPADIFLLKKMLHASSLHINTVYTTDRIIEAQKALNTKDFHIALLDLSLPDSFGIETYLGIKPSAQKIPVIILTGLNDANIALEALKQGAQDYLVKGNFNGDLLFRAIQYSLERKKAEEALRISEEKYRQIFYKNFFPALIYDPVCLKILEVNDAAIDKYGYNREEFLSLTLKDIGPLKDNSITVKTTGHSNEPPKLWKHKKKNGDVMVVEITLFPITYFGKIAAQVQIHDVTEKIKLQKKLKYQQKAAQKNITAAVLKALENEKARLGEELHDNINQMLGTSILYLEHAKNNIEARDELIGKSLNIIFSAVEEIRNLSKTLIVRDIPEIGLRESIQETIAGILLVKDIQITLDMENFPEKKIDKNVQIIIYRIIQEQLTNIIKHADARKVMIELKKKGRLITLDISDDGKGFDTALRKKGIGFTNMNSRASLYDGEVRIISAPGKGCLLKATLKLKN